MTIDYRINDLKSAIDKARCEYHRLVWVAGGNESKRTALLRALSNAEDGIFVDIGKKLSSALIEIPAPFRTTSVENCFSSLIEESPKRFICIDHLEVLFEPNLRINPVGLIQRASKNYVIVASWPGAVNGGLLTYGSHDHPGYKKLSEQDLEAIVHFI